MAATTTRVFERDGIFLATAGSRLRCLLVCGLLVASVWSDTSVAADAKTIVLALNAQYGAICTATLEGWFSKTLKVDWTARTTKLHVLKIFGEIANVKSDLYEDGVRYFKFPNDSGGYNIIDWKTGEKTSINERAPYYFP
jgi:hypothetical protein